MFTSNRQTKKHLNHLARLVSLSHKGSLLGPVGFAILALGYTVASGIARIFVSVESFCTQSCPIVRVQGFRMHHMYYGLVLVFISAIVLLYAKDIRTRWDSALILGIGLGLFADEIGLLILKIGYWNTVSVGVLLTGSLTLVTIAFYKAIRNKFNEFQYLDRYQLFWILGLMLAFTGFLYFDRPVRTIVEMGALSAWLSSVLLVAKYGRKHIWLIRNMPLSYDPQPR